MKYTILLKLFLIASSVSAQDTSVMWLDNTLKPVKEKHSVYRQEVSMVEGLYKITTFDVDNNVIMEALSNANDGQSITGDVRFFHTNGNMESSGQYHKGKKLGVWLRYDQSGKEKSERIYNLFDHESMAYHYTNVMPLFPGGEENFIELLKLNFPHGVNKSVSNGELLKYSFVINTNGNIDNIRIIKSISKELDAELKSTLSKMPNWKPGEKNGEKVRVIIEREIYCGK